MADSSNIVGKERAIPWRIIGWSIPPLILLLPLIANAPWTLFDYVVMGVMFGGAGLLVELVVRASGNWAYRAGAFIAIAAIFLLVWVNGAVGFLGDEDNPANLMFGGVILVAVVGSVFLGFHASGMAKAMFAAAAAQVLAGVIGLAGGFASPGADGLYEVAMGTTLFGSMWLVSAGLFRKAAEQQASVSAR